MSSPLKGIKILDLTHMLAGPYGTMLLADLGAEIIKIEPPIKGEITRSLLNNDPNYSVDGVGPYHLTLGRNKKSLTLDLKSEPGKNIFYQLVKKADVVIDNFSSGVMKRLKIDHETLKGHNEKIISCSISGFGEDAESNRPAYDNIIQGISGLMSLTGSNHKEPIKSGVPISDLSTGMFAIIGILTALRNKEATGKGEKIDISMLDCQASLLNYIATMHLISGKDPEPIGNEHPVHTPFNSYKTADGFIILSVVHEDFWPNLVQALDLKDLDIEEYETATGRSKDRVKIDSILEEIFITNTTEHWLKILNEHRVPCGPVNKLSEVFNDPDLIKREMIAQVKQPSGAIVKMPGNPIKIGDAKTEYKNSPELGEHSLEILNNWLGMTEEQIAELKEDNII
jgi:crotonobetainyl-CoA:carnitine CoA-transferase CaiB-like acyl-CoA transferase